MKRVILFFVVFALFVGVATPAALAQEVEPAAQDQILIPGDEGWDGRFGLPGIPNNEVTAMATAADGTLYAGGRFTEGILRWDGLRWQPLGQGLNNYPEQLLVGGDGVLYAIGNFTKAGTVTTKGLAKWNGTAWSRIGNGVGPKNKYGDDGQLYTAALLGDDLIVGGDFVSIDGVAARNIARWDGAAWHALAVGLADFTWEEDALGDYGSVQALAVVGDVLYAGGDFDAADNGGALVRVHNVARWDGATWAALGGGVTGETSFENGTVYALAANADVVYAAGNFIAADGQPANNIAGWDGANWQALGDGLGAEFSPFRMVETMLLVDGNLYVGGEFDYAGGADSPVLARWDGVNWSPLANDIERFGKGEVHALVAAPGGGIYVGGEFTTIDQLLIYNVAFFDGEGWQALGKGVTQFDTGDTPGKVYAMDTDAAGRVYIAGSFKTAGGKPVNNVAMWDGANWHALGDGVNGDVRALVTVGDDVYVAGSFTAAGNVAANRVARWNRISGQWSGLGSGINDNVYALAYANGVLYAGGGFTAAGNVTAYDLAWWDGAQWHAFGTQYRIYERSQEGGEVGTTVYALAASGDDVVIGGQFQTIHKLGTDTQNLGNYELANNVVLWNRAADQWTLLGPWTGSQEPGVTTNGYSGFGTSVRSLAIVGGDVYVGGMFNQAGTISAGNIARWNAATDAWSALGGGLGGLDTTGLSDSPAAALDVVGKTLVVGGYFTVAGNSGARYVALFDTLTQSWSALGSGIAYYNDKYTAVYAVTAQGSEIYAGGQFDKAGGLASSGFAHWSVPTRVDEIPAAGGALTEDDGTRIEFPAGAAPAGAIALYTPLFALTHPMDGAALPVRSFVFEAMDGDGPLSTTAQPYTLRVPYSEVQLAALGIEDPSTLELMRWDGTTWQPVFPCDGCSVDTTNRTVIAKVSQFGEFVLVGEKAAPPAEYRFYLPGVRK